LLHVEKKIQKPRLNVQELGRALQTRASKKFTEVKYLGYYNPEIEKESWKGTTLRSTGAFL
jgi:hypothetical protein